MYSQWHHIKVVVQGCIGLLIMCVQCFYIHFILPIPEFLKVVHLCDSIVEITVNFFKSFSPFD